MMSPILWQIGKSSNLFEKRTKLQYWITPSLSMGKEASTTFIEHTYRSDLYDLWGKMESTTTA
jgi:hypothetical protein